MCSLASLNRQRGVIKTKSTKLTKFVNEFVHEADKDVELEITLRCKLDIIRELKVSIKELITNYTNLPVDTDLKDALDLSADLEQEIEELEVRLNIYLSKLNLNSKIVPITETVSLPRINFKIPDLPLPSFSGRYEEFQNFKTQFMSIIGNNKELNPTQQLCYLKGCLKGEAKRLESAQDTYESLWKSLEERYQNKRAVIDCHIINLLNLAKVPDSPNQLMQLIDKTKCNLRALNLLDFKSNELSDTLIMHILFQKLDPEIRNAFEMKLNKKEIPKLDDFLLFLEERSRIIQGMQYKEEKRKMHFPQKVVVKPRERSFLINKPKTKQSCILGCAEYHALYRCNKFREMDVSKRIQIVQKYNHCNSCLNKHPQPCLSNKSCFLCKSKQHNTLLHSESEFNDSLPPDASAEASTNISSGSMHPEINNSTLLANENKKNRCSVILNTAVIYLKNCFGEYNSLIAALDSCSSLNLLSCRAANLLGLRKEKAHVPISGINDTGSIAKSFIRTELTNKDKTKTFNLDMLVVPKIAILPPSHLNVSQLNIPDNIALADNKWNQPKRIDALLGAGLFYELIGSNKIKIDNSNLMLVETIFGHVISGTYAPNSDSYEPSNSCFFSVESENLDKTLCSFWEIEDVNPIKPLVSEELEYCNEHFLKTHYRKSDGTYVVELPFKPEFINDISLGDSKQNAIKRLNQLWKRLEREPKLKELYVEFLREYEVLGHMQEVAEELIPNDGYFFPHHGVLRPSSHTTKLRVVFDGSCKTTNGKSLNDLLCKGGIVQDDLFAILIRFRKHTYAFTVDINKMFRQIEVSPAQTKFQKILWKEGKEEPIKIYQLKTVTYGCASSPYLATRVLQQLAIDEATNFPLASKVVLEDFYVDDCLSGSSDWNEFNDIKMQLTSLFQKGNMTLHKWHSGGAEEPPELQDYSFDHNNLEVSVKTLGMLWNSCKDTFNFKVTVNISSSYTKREILGQIARIFDPLGLLGPVICRAKIFMQLLWLLKCDWNDLIPRDMTQEWSKFLKSLPIIETLNVPRCILIKDHKSLHIHGFADACERAYGAVLYLQVLSESALPVNHIICSKSRVAPIKTVSIPRLELSACLLLCQLTQRVVASLKLKMDSVLLYSDSTIALSWIDTSPHLLKTFVSNRVSQIQELSKGYEWKYISSTLNPADALSRGQDALSLSNNKLWWKGPEFLSQDNPISVPQEPLCSKDELFVKELKSTPILTAVISLDNFNCLLNITNCYVKLIRVLAFIYRFVTNCRDKDKLQGPLSFEELKKAKNKLVKDAQSEYFSEDISALKRGMSVPARSKLKYLHPFLDKDGLLRVGGRLTNANLSYDRSHQIILPPNSKLSKMIFLYYHKRDLHVGPQGLLNSIRLTFWPINGRNLARQTVHNCVQCFKIKPTTVTQIMGDLPSERVSQNSPFANVGLDLCGPFLIKYRNQRKGIYNKVYVAIFICMVTKAVHFELLSDLTSSALIATLKRFFSRRGKSSTIFCDNATNFVGASAEQKKFLSSVNKKDDDVSSFLSSEQVLWRFLPPRSPNFGGLWERGVGQFKYHLKRTIGSTKLTLEEFLTVTVQIEGILNSRPLSPLSTDLEDFEVLTPGHFLIGKPINALPEQNLINKNENLLDRWQKTQRFVQLIWKNWSNSYLSNLQQRSKWYFQKQNVTPGTMVLVKEGELPVCKWIIGRIDEIIVGKDNNVRVVIVRTPHGVYKRSISNICILPIDNKDSVNLLT